MMRSNGLFQQMGWYYQNFRVKDWRAYFGIGLLGFVLGLEELTQFDHRVFLLFITTSSLYLAFSFSINNCFDVKNDVKEHKMNKNPVASGLIGFKEGVFVSVLTASIGMLMACLWLNFLSSCIYTILLLLSLGYSAPPLRLKSVPVADLMSHGLFFGSLLFLYGASAVGNLNPYVIALAFPLFIHSVALNLRNHLDDFDEDMLSKTKTTACWLGRPSSVKILNRLLVIHWVVLSIITLCVNPLFGILVNSVVPLIFLGLKKYVSSVRATDVCVSLIYMSTIAYLVVL